MYCCKFLTTLPSAPLLLLIPFPILSASSSDKGATFYNFPYYLNPRLGLASQWPLRFWLCLILTYFLVTGVICWSGYELAFTAEGFDKFVEISKFPLALLSLTIPVGVFISRLHSTQQTAAQIEAAESKNRLDAFHGQRKGIVEYIDSIGEIELAPQKKIKLRVNQAFHSIVFCDSTHLKGANEANETVIANVTSNIDSALGHLAHLMPSIQELAKRREAPSKFEPTLHYIHLVDITKKLCEYLNVLDYTLSSDEIRQTKSFAWFDEHGRQQTKKFDIPTDKYYGILALLNYCCTITLHAATSEHRSANDLKLLDIKLLHAELRFLCFANIVGKGDDKVLYHSQRYLLHISSEGLSQLPLDLRV
ncbi:hypothetical protein [Pseudomonas sp. PB106]|uniref:hypothetical protein n=1 Tax=Pseudomonas sp. PB106 TaxID=2494699 RepID=UPI00131C695C|nr:hypothetical protein [Pseudomonas sp. PB106]KAE9649117.1 hypothetical protein EJA71_03420 [Pseudomonas sp. PB106]